MADSDSPSGTESSPEPFDVADYWDTRYRSGGDSGAGSRGRLGKHKAEVINRLVRRYEVRSVIDFGCGDGMLLKLLELPRYLGLDIAPSIIDRLRKEFAKDSQKDFALYRPGRGYDAAAHMALSIDVIYHQVDDKLYDQYMRDLFLSALRLVLIYSTDKYREPCVHERHRKFSDWIHAHRPDWERIGEIPPPYPLDPKDPDTSDCSFFLYSRG